MLRNSRLPKKASRNEEARYRAMLRQSERLHVEEFEAFFEDQQREGRCFRFVLLFVVVSFLSLLLWLKWDREHLVAPIKEQEDEETEQLFDVLNLKGEENRQKKVEEAFKKMSAELQKDAGECPDCDKRLVELKTAYNALSARVVNDYHKVLNIPSSAGYHDVKKAYLKAKEEAEKGNSKYDLVELKEAYDTMSHPEARAYYNLYGLKPPPSMKHQQKTTHGGWGVEMGMGTFKYALLRAWLDYFDNPWVEVGFFVFIFLMMGIKVWNNWAELKDKLEQMEKESE